MTAIDSVDPDDRKSVAKTIAHHLFTAGTSEKKSSTNVSCRLKQLLGCVCVQSGHFAPLYLFVKGLFCLNALLQLFLLNSFLQVDGFFGISLLNNLLNDISWSASGLFPRVTFCDFKIREMNVHFTDTIQCVLPLNLFHEKIYVFLWFWCAIVAVTTFFNAFWWLYLLLVRSQSSLFLAKFLRMSDISYNEKHFNYFFRKIRRLDVVFVLRLLNSNIGPLVTKQVVESLWKIHFPKGMANGVVALPESKDKHQKITRFPKLQLTNQHKRLYEENEMET